ncbi:MAG: hypothetical protein U5Q16_11905 [Gammaproteobacteria bacterium]|nr:hypothetical protein [Gammaproteobacteria bacterium]
MNPSDDLLLVERDNGITTVTLNRPEALNALSAALRNRIAEVFSELAGDPDTEVGDQAMSVPISRSSAARPRRRLPSPVRIWQMPWAA